MTTTTYPPCECRCNCQGHVVPVAAGGSGSWTPGLCGHCSRSKYSSRRHGVRGLPWLLDDIAESADEN